MSNFAKNPPPIETVEISDQARRIHLTGFLAKAPDPDAIWVFGAGSLIWRPGFDPAEARNGTLHGYSRQFSFWTIRARGRPDNPGLGLALEPDPSTCQGKVFRLQSHSRNEDMEALWLREMLGGVYFPTWCPVVTDGGMVPAICFVGNRDHRNYAGRLPENEVAAIIARADGDLGRCREYLDLLVAALESEGLDDPAMVRLRDLVDGHEEGNR